LIRRILLIAKRDYLSSVLSKTYLFGLILLPLMMGGGFLGLSLLSRGDAKQQRVGVIDRTGVSGALIIQAAEERNRERSSEPVKGRRRTSSQYVFEEIKPEADQSAQLLSLSERIRKGDLYVLIDIAPGALRPSENPKKDLVRLYSNSAVLDQLNLLLNGAVNEGIRRARLAQLGVDPARMTDILSEVSMVSMGLPSKDAATGKVEEAEERNPIQTVVLPLFLVVMLLLIVMLGSAQKLGTIAEDKMQRVFEMLLSSATPFELMMGKVLAALGISLTSSVFYIAGGLLALAGLATIGLAPLGLLPWFLVYLIIDVMMLAAMAAALGSACGTPQDAQSLVYVLFMPVLIPMFVITPVMQQPNGAFATVMSLIPPFTPLLMLMRQALPGGVPWWQPWIGLVGMVACTIFVTWAAARVFRIGILAQGKAPKVSELARWVVRG